MRIGLVLGGDPPTPHELKLLDACDEIVACDAGAHALLKAERPPQLIIGDLDSLTADDYKWAEALDVPIERHPEDKDETDGEIALTKVLARKPRSVMILGGHGGRSGMFLANLKILRRIHEAGLDAVMLGHGESVRFVSAGGEVNLAGRSGSTLNVLADGADAVIGLSGTKWETEETRLSHLSCRGLSNLIEKDGARVTCKQGTVLVIVEQPKEK